MNLEKFSQKVADVVDHIRRVTAVPQSILETIIQFIEEEYREMLYDESLSMELLRLFYSFLILFYGIFSIDISLIIKAIDVINRPYDLPESKYSFIFI